MEQKKKTPRTGASDIYATLLAGFILLKIVAIKNPSFVWFSWWGTILIPICTQFVIILLYKAAMKVAGKVGQRLYFRNLERIQRRIIKDAGERAKKWQQDDINKSK